MKAVYYAVLTAKENGSGYYCRVPDLPGCVTTGKELYDTIEMIEDAANLWLCEDEDRSADAHHAAPPMTPLERIPHDEQDICTLISVDTLAYRAETDNRCVRKNVSLPAWMIRQSDCRGINCSQVLQDALRRMLEK